VESCSRLEVVSASRPGWVVLATGDVRLASGGGGARGVTAGEVSSVARVADVTHSS